MAKRSGRSGGGLGGGITRPYLNQLINSCGKDLTTAEDIVDDLRSRYPNIAQLIRQRLLLKVRQALNDRVNKRVKDEDEDEDYHNGDEESAVKRKKQRRLDEKEAKLQRAEESHIRRRNRERSVSSSPSCSSEDTADVSTSEDAVYSEKLSPRFDLINDSLRDNYAKMNNSSKKTIESPSPVEKNVEVETVTNKGRSKMATMGSKKEAKGALSGSGTTGNGGLEVDVDKRPTFKDFGGIKKVLDDLEVNVLFPILNPQPLQKLGVKPPSGILFHGPPGCGKTKLANAIANEVGVPFYKISATDIVSGVSGASEENIRELFSKAYRSAPSIVFIDEIDAIASKRENQQREMEKRIVTQLLTCMDGPDNKGDKNGNADSPDSDSRFVLVIGATNRPDALDPALRRPGRFECEIALSVPDEEARAEILAVVAQKLRLEGPFDRTRIARITPGFVGADLHGVANMAGRIAIKRILDSRKSELSKDGEDDKSWLRQPWSSEELEKLFVTMSDFEEAVKVVQASSTREGFSTVPDIKWDDVGGLDHLRQEFNRYIVRRIKSPEIHKAFGVDLETGFLLYGPPGCGKTLIAKAVANEAGANFIHIKGPELLNKYVGESELAIRTLFQRARTCSPCVLFFDEVDALTTSRGKEGAWVVERLLNQFLAELDGGERRNVYVIGATNRPDVVDPAFMRPGRFGNLLYVPLPNVDERVSILKALAKKKPIDSTVDLTGIAKMSNCEDFSGADLAALVHEAALQAVEEKQSSNVSEDVPDSTKCTIKMTHFEQALSKLSPSVSKQQRKHYEDLSRKLQGSMGRNIEQITRASTFAIDEDYHNGNEESAVRRKKQRRLDEKEAKLQRAEESHIRRRNRERSVSSSPSCSSEDTADVSTSEDAVYSEKISPRFDLINDSLRDNYAKMNNSSKKTIESPSPVEKNVEVETVTNKGRSKMATMGAKKEAKGSLSASGTTGNGGLEVDVDKGPTFKDFGGIKKVLDDLEMNVLFPILNPQPLQKLGVKPPSGILFHGPPGCGKTKLANAIANEVGVPFYKISATDIVSGVSGASEENIRELFSKAYRSAPSIVFIDEIDAIASKRENQQREMEKRIVTQLLTCMDGPDNKGYKNVNADSPDSDARFVLVIGATNRPDALDPALRRPGRFECEIALSVPDEEARAEILAVVAQKLRLEGPFDRTRIARITPGFVGADLHGVANMAGRIAIKRILDSRKSELSKDGEDDKSWLRQPWPSEELDKLFVTMSDFEEAVKVVQASSTREGFSTVPDVKWDDVGGLDHLRQEFNRYIVRPIKSPEIHKSFGVDLETGFLLYGPPGCGKTLIAKAVANEAGANFIHIKGPELLNKYVGESELAIRTLFQRARTCSPCVLFFDEVDALTTSRGKEGAWVVERLLNQFLAELDGGERRNVYVIGATNRPDVVDPAFMRPGRFGNLLYVPLPNADERVSILKALAKKKPIDSTVDLTGIAKMSNCEDFSGADLAALVHEAALQAVEEKLSSNVSEDVPDLTKCTIKMTHFEQALSKLSPSVSKQQRKHYEDLSRKLQGSMGRNIEQITRVSTFVID